MEWIKINYLAWLLAAMSGYVLGAIWFMPKIFGNVWLQALGKTRDELGSPITAMLTTLFTTFASAYVLCVLLVLLKIQTLASAVMISLLTGLGIYVMNVWSDALFCGWRNKVILIQAGYRVSMLVLISVIYVTVAY